ncbi:unnamed protein product [Rotaria sp. Silwood1]|nr:unnamed protein product [Rotaria sp. Silwood1]
MSLLLLLLPVKVVLINSSNVTNTRRCPSKCTIVSLNRASLYRREQDCSNVESFVKCSATQAINESLTPSLFDKFFYHHTQVTFYANVSETNVDIHNACFDKDNDSRIFAQKIANQLLGYRYVELEESIKLIIYDPHANTETQFFTPNLQYVIDNIGTAASCNITGYVLSSSISEQRLCWLGTLVSLHVYTENNLLTLINTTIALSYNCNTRGLLCNGPEMLQNVTEIVNKFFNNPPYIDQSDSCTKCTPKCSCVYAPRGVVHTFRNINGINARPALLQFWFSPAGIENYFQQVSCALNQKPPDLDLVMEIAKEWGIDIIGSPNWSIAG